MWQKSGNARFESAKRPRNQSTRADRVVGSPSTLGKFQKTTMLVTRAIAIVLVLQYFGIADASRILAVFPSNYKSHYTLGKVVFTELANRGHQVFRHIIHIFLGKLLIFNLTANINQPIFVGPDRTT